MLLTLHEPGQTPDPHSTEYETVIGIDFGTTHSVVAYVDQSGIAHTVPIAGKSLCPSVIWQQENEILIGAEAFTKQEAIHSIKRRLAAREKTAITLTISFLRFIREAAESHLNTSVHKAVLTVPAYFDENARSALRKAAHMAGLSILRLLPEPTAAAMAYGLDAKKFGVYAVYDLGGGTFDMSIVKCEKGVFQVLSTAGDTSLGGDDIDKAIAQHYKESLLAARARKEEGNDAAIESIMTPFIDTTLALTERALLDANIRREEVSGVILVGGSTKSSYVRRRLRTFFNKEPICSLDPDISVAVGAAYHARALVDKSDTLLLDVQPLSLGVELMGGLHEKLIHRNTPLPCAVAQDLTTYQDNQTAMTFHIVQGEYEFADDCLSLGRFTLRGLPPLPAGAVRVRLTFTLDADGILSVEATEKVTGIQQDITLTPSYELSDEDITLLLTSSAAQGKADIEKRLLLESSLAAEQILRATEQALAVDAALLSVQEQEIITESVKMLKKALATKKREVIDTATDQLKKTSHAFAERRVEHHVRVALTGKTYDDR